MPEPLLLLGAVVLLRPEPEDVELLLEPELELLEEDEFPLDLLLDEPLLDEPLWVVEDWCVAVDASAPGRV